jgi:hypothetical protein
MRSGESFPAIVSRKRPDGQLCMPHGALARKPFPHSHLCFRKNEDGAWRIAGHINGGD